MPALCEHFIQTFMLCNELSKYTRKIHGGLYMLGKAQGQGHTACEMKLSAKPNSGNALTHRLYMAEKKSTHKWKWVDLGFLKTNCEIRIPSVMPAHTRLWAEEILHILMCVVHIHYKVFKRFLSVQHHFWPGLIAHSWDHGVPYWHFKVKHQQSLSPGADTKQW